MADDINRREWIKTVGAAGAAAGFISPDTVPPSPLAAPVAPHQLSPHPSPAPLADGDISPLVNTSEVTIPPRGGRMRFSFDFPEPSVAFGGHRFAFIVFTDENTYAPDIAGMGAVVQPDGSMMLACDGFVWAGGQEKAKGKMLVEFRRDGPTIEVRAGVGMAHPVRAITVVVRDVPKGRISLGGNPPAQNAANDAEVLAGYTFGAGDLHGGSPVPGISTPFVAVEASATEWWYASSLDSRVRPKRFDFQPGETAYRVELVYEHDAWRDDVNVTAPPWRIGRASSLDAAAALHWAHLERAYNIPSYDTRPDVPDWMRKTALVLTMHGQHYTGYIFNTYAQQLEILRWVATQIPAERVLVFLAAWDGRYYWDYPNYVVSDRMGGEQGFRTLITEAQKLGFRMMPMYGCNSANRRQPVWPKIAASETRKIDGDTYFLNWVDWNNDRHQDGWLTYMNLGHDAWRSHLTERIAWMIETFGVDAYFLDIVGGHVNSTTGDMHEGTRRMVTELRRRFPKVLCVGEMPYDALYEFIAVYHAGGGPRWQKYARFFSHLSAPAPGRGSSGVHESGFGRFNADTLGLGPNTIPTLQIVDDTFSKHRDVMAAVIAKAKERLGNG